MSGQPRHVAQKLNESWYHQKRGYIQKTKASICSHFTLCSNNPFQNIGYLFFCVYFGGGCGRELFTVVGVGKFFLTLI